MLLPSGGNFGVKRLPKCKSPCRAKRSTTSIRQSSTVSWHKSLEEGGHPMLCHLIKISPYSPHSEITIFNRLMLFPTDLSLAEPITTIVGGPDLYIDTGSTVNLTCIVRHLPEPPPLILWTHNSEVSRDIKRACCRACDRLGPTWADFDGGR